jgi:zinc transport system permease protein
VIRALGVTLPYPFDLPFMQRALLASLAVGIFAPMIGTFLVQKRLALIGDGIGHVAFAGVGAGVLAGGGVWPIRTALVFAVVGALGVEWLRARRRASGDVALALLFYSGLALGVVLVSRANSLDGSVLRYLFGQPLTVTDGEIATIARLGAVIVAVVVVLQRALFAVVTDEDWSRTAGLPVGRSFAGTLRWGIAIGAGSVVVGLGLSFVWDLAPSGTIVLVATAVFGVLAAATRRATRTLRQEEHG